VKKAFEKIRLRKEANRYAKTLESAFEKTGLKEKKFSGHSENILHSAVHNIILTIDNDRIIRTFNVGAKRILGYDNGYFSSFLNLYELFHKKDHDELNVAFAKAFIHGEYSFELNWKTKSGDFIPVSSEIYVLKDENSEPIGFLIIGFDISNRKKIQSQISHTDKLATIGKIASGVAHEINNPIASITACAQSLLKEIKKADAEIFDEPIFSRYLGIIIEQAFRCKQIIDNLLDYSRNHEVVRGDVDPQALILDAIELTIHQVKKESQNIDFNQNPDVGLINGDPNKLKQLFVNILSNAFDAISYKKEEGRIKICAKTKKDKVFISIKDNGVGIDKKNIKNVFDPFFTTKTPGAGTGLGLSICKEIVDMHGGEIKIRSYPDKSTTVIVILPKGKVDF